MGFNDIDIKVSGGSDIISTLKTYTTRILKPNIVDGKNVLTQEMLSSKNTKYVIKYVYELLGATLTIPQNVILEFDGGSIKNGTLVGNDTLMLNTNETESVLDNVTLDGTWKESSYDLVEEVVADKAPGDGMGRIILRKDKTFAEQLTQENTIYVIRYDFELTEDVTIPANCVLQFDGGSISGADITFDHTIIASQKNHIFQDVTPKGTIGNDRIYAEWFKFSDNTYHYYTFFCTCLALGNCTFVLEEDKKYNLDMSSASFSGYSILLNSNTRIEGNNATLNVVHENSNVLFQCISKENIYVENLVIAADNTEHYIPAPAGHGDTMLSSGVYCFYINDTCNNFKLFNVKTEKILYVVKTSSKNLDSAHYDNIIVDNCHLSGDMPIQGNMFINLQITNCKISCISDNDGCHAIYVIPKLTPINDEDTKNNRIYVKDTAFIMLSNTNPALFSVYSASNTVEDAENYHRAQAFFENCKFYNGHYSCAGSIDVYFTNCIFENSVQHEPKHIGRAFYENCVVDKYRFYGRTYIKNSIVTNNGGFIFGYDDRYISYHEVVNSIIEADTVSSYCNGSNLIKSKIKVNNYIYRPGGSEETINTTIKNCDIHTTGRLVNEGSSRQNADSFKFICCIINSDNISNLENSGNANVIFDYKDCVIQDVFYSNGYWRNSGTTAERPFVKIVGFTYFDTTIGKPIYASAINGSTVTWVDATGQTV